MHKPTGSMQLGHRQAPLLSLARRIDACRAQALSAARHLHGSHLQRLRARGPQSVLGLSAAPLAAMGLAGTAHVVWTSGAAPSGSQKSLADFGHPRRRLTDMLLLLNVVAFGLQWYSKDYMLVWGAKVNQLIAQGQWYRLVSCTFLHGNLLHLFTNCQALASLGPFVENNAGHARFLAIYATSAIAGSLASYMFCPSMSVGASGAIFGLGAALALIVHRHRDSNKAFSQVMLKSLGQSLLINMAIGFSVPQIDNWNHAGGLVGGALTCFLLGPLYVKDGSYLRDRPPLPLLADPPRTIK